MSKLRLPRLPKILFDGFRVFCDIWCMGKTDNKFNAAPSGSTSKLAVLPDNIGSSVDFKKCTKCGKEKPLAEFYNNRTKANGKSSRCKKCFSIGYISWAKRNPKLNCARSILWTRNHPEAGRIRYKNNPELYRERSRRWWRKNPEKSKAHHLRESLNLADSYVLKIFRWDCPKTKISPELIKLKRALILLYRTLKQQTNQPNT